MTMNQISQEWIEVAKVAGAFGVRGLVRVVPLAEGASLKNGIPWLLKEAAGTPKMLRAESIARHGDIFLVRFNEIHTKEEADACRGILCVRREDFPQTQKGEHWAVDLIDFDVINKEGRTLGTLKSFASNGVQDILVVVGSSGKTHLIPMVKSYVLAIDEQKRTITVDWHEDWS